jgi:hypothetical protein
MVQPSSLTVIPHGLVIPYTGDTVSAPIRTPGHTTSSPPIDQPIRVAHKALEVRDPSNRLQLVLGLCIFVCIEN